jgi:hypothetical protein
MRFEGRHPGRSSGRGPHDTAVPARAADKSALDKYTAAAAHAELVATTLRTTRIGRLLAAAVLSPRITQLTFRTPALATVTIA